MSEKQLQAAVLELAANFNWRCYHTFDSRRSARGFPDLVMVRGSRLLFVELKSEIGQVSLEQADWIEALAGPAKIAGGAISGYLWRPSDWAAGRIEQVLR